MSYNSLKVFFDDFIKSGLVVRTRKLGKSDYYKLNLENPFVMDLLKLDWKLVRNTINTFLENKHHQYDHKYLDLLILWRP